MDRVAWLLNTTNRSSRIIEIGAGYNPIAPKAAGWRTHVVDHAPQEELRQKYAAANVDVAAIEDVDTIWRDGPLDAAVRATTPDRFDTLIASHLIEHMPDLVGFLMSAERLLKPDGVIALAVPDKRYCFDYFRPLTTTGNVLEAHLARRTRHTISTAWDHTAYAVVNGGALGWGREPVQQLTFINDFTSAAARYAIMSQGASKDYQDYHAWTFTPSSFALMILELGCLGVIDWRIDKIEGSDHFEFFVLLRRGARQHAQPEELQAERMRLLRAQMQDLAEQLAHAPGAGGPS